MVYVTSPRPVWICVSDAGGKPQRFEVLPEGRSFYGKAPWQLQAQSLQELQIFFQGSKVALPRNATDRVELVERPLGP